MRFSGRRKTDHLVVHLEVFVLLAIYMQIGTCVTTDERRIRNQADVFQPLRAANAKIENFTSATHLPVPLSKKLPIELGNLKRTTLKTKKKRDTELQRTKVVGGKTAERNEFPFQVLIQNSTGVYCGGSILHKNFILTAAHCVYGYEAQDYKSWTIVAGDHNWQEDDGTEQRRQIDSVHIHRRYIPIAEVNDLAIIKLDRPLHISKEVQPALLPPANYEATGEAVVTGWGAVRFRGSTPNVLKKVTVPIVAMEDCVKAYEREQVFVSIFMLCAGDVVEGGVDACQGDSGGPLSVPLGNGTSMLIGVVSSGIGCARREYPGIYMKVSKYVDWIQETLRSLGVNECRYPGMCAVPSDAGHCHRCRDGFVKDPYDSTRLRCTYANVNASIVISSDKDIKMISLNGANPPQTVQNKGPVFGLDYDFRTNTVFWFNEPDSTVYKASINGESEKQSVAQSPSFWIFGISVDWINNNIYWVDNGGDAICVSNFNGTMKKVLVNKELVWPRSIAVNPLNGWMYWVDKEKNRIERAGMDGSRRQVILGTNMQWPSGLVVDFDDNRLYWSDGSIWSSDFDGSDRKLVFEPSSAQFSSGILWKIAMLNEYVYLIEWNSKTVFKVNKCNGEEFEVLYKSESDLRDIRIYDSTLQPKGENICSKRIDQCSHFCLPVPAPVQSPRNGSVPSTTCACPDGLSLSADQRTCTS